LRSPVEIFLEAAQRAQHSEPRFVSRRILEGIQSAEPINQVGGSALHQSAPPNSWSPSVTTTVAAWTFSEMRCTKSPSEVVDKTAPVSPFHALRDGGRSGFGDQLEDPRYRVSAAWRCFARPPRSRRTVITPSTGPVRRWNLLMGSVDESTKVSCPNTFRPMLSHN